MIKGNVWNGACTEFYKRRADKFLGDYGVTCNWHSYKLFPLQKYILSHWLQVQHVWDKNNLLYTYILEDNGNSVRMQLVWLIKTKAI